MRLFTSGFELNVGINITTDQDKEWHVDSTGQTIVTSPVRSGNYALKARGGDGTEQLYFQFLSANNNGPIFSRVYLRIESYPDVRTSIIETTAITGSTGAGIFLNDDGSLQLFDANGLIGSPSSPLSLNTWYMIETKVDRTGGTSRHIIEAKLDGVVFATSNTRNISSGVARIYVGVNLENDGAATGVWYFDDVAVNDSSGSFENSYPGEGSVIALRPNAAGDSNSFATQTGGTAGSSNNYTRVNEVSPDDATTYNGSSTLNEEDFFNIEDSGIDPTDIIKLVSLGMRFRNSTADATGAFKVQAKKATGGTVSQSDAIIPNSTTWKSNGKTLFTSPLTLYQDPDNIDWTPTTLDSMQIGYKQTANPGTAGRRIDISSIWATVEFKPGNQQVSGPFPTHFRT